MCLAVSDKSLILLDLFVGRESGRERFTAKHTPGPVDLRPNTRRLGCFYGQTHGGEGRIYGQTHAGGVVSEAGIFSFAGAGMLR